MTTIYVVEFLLTTHTHTTQKYIPPIYKIPTPQVRPKEGDSHPIGSLPIGTVVSCIEKIPNNGASFALSAGTSAVLIKKVRW